MIVPKSLTYEKLESLYATLLKERPSVLRVPLSISYKGPFGLHAALIQFLITWARTVRDPTLHLYSDSPGVTQHAHELSKKPFGLVALEMSASIETQEHVKVSNAKIRAECDDFLGAMFSGDLLRSVGSKGFRPPYIHLASAQHSHYEFIKPIYGARRYGGVRSRQDFVRLIADSLSTLLTKRKAETISSVQKAQLAGLLHELVKNTDEYTTTDVTGSVYPKGIRGILISSSKLPGTAKNQFLTKQSGFNAHLVSALHEGAETLEISVYDSGPGFADRWISIHGSGTTPSTGGSEFEIVKHCFAKWSSSKVHSGAGMGLHEVLQILAELQGFLFLRTGRVCLFQSFRNVPKGTEATFSPKPFFSKSAPVPAEGTVITVSIPI